VENHTASLIADILLDRPQVFTQTQCPDKVLSQPILTARALIHHAKAVPTINTR
jgi:hypothetical protein